jgi:hypothetical protein
VLLGHGPYEVLVAIGDLQDLLELFQDLQDLLELFQGGLSPLGAAEPVRDPDVVSSNVLRPTG